MGYFIYEQTPIELKKQRLKYESFYHKNYRTTQQDFAMLLRLDKKANKLWDQIRMWDGQFPSKNEIEVCS